MTNFNKNPHKEARSAFNRLLFRSNLDETLDSKFKHKTFSERFALANAAFLAMGFVAQISSTITAYVMLSYLFDGTPFLVRLIASITLLVAVEIVKRLSTNDVMQGVFQYKSVEYFPAILSAVTLATSIYIAVEGAKILPDLLIPDAVQEEPVQQTPDAINEDYDNRIAAVETEREVHRKERKWQGRLASKDAKIIKEHNKNIHALQVKKDSALAILKAENKAARTKAFQVFEERSAEVKVERAVLADKLVIAAIGFEVLFVISMCFSWWYYVECEKERRKQKEATEKLKNANGTTEVPTQKADNKSDSATGVHQGTTEVHGGTAPVQANQRSQKKASFIDYEEVTETPEVHKRTPEVQEVTVEVQEKVKYTRHCKRCGKPFIHNSANHKYCERACMRKDLADEKKKKRQQNEKKLCSVVFNEIDTYHYTFTADVEGKSYQGSIKSISQGNGKVLTSIYSSPKLDAGKKGLLMDKYIEYRKG